MQSKCEQEKMRGQRRRLQVQALGYELFPQKLFLAISLERKSVFRDVRITANLNPASN